MDDWSSEIRRRPPLPPVAVEDLEITGSHAQAASSSMVSGELRREDVDTSGFNPYLGEQLSQRLRIAALGLSAGAVLSMPVRPDALSILSALAMAGLLLAAVPARWTRRLSPWLTAAFAQVAILGAMLVPADTRLASGVLASLVLASLLPVPGWARTFQVLGQASLILWLGRATPTEAIPVCGALLVAWLFGRMQVQHWRTLWEDREVLAHLTDRLSQESGRRQAAIQAREKELLDQQAVLVMQEQWATLGRVAVGVGHEIKNPLQAAMSDVETARREGDLSTLDDAMRSLERIRAILLDLSQLRGETAEDVKTYGLRDLVQATVRGARIGLNNIDVRVDRLPDVAVRANHGRLVQVIANLLTNAWHEVERRGHGKLHVHGRVVDNMLLLFVDDDGPGIPRELRTRIFEPFVTTKKAGKGTGLGLPISRGLMRAMGGDLFADDGSELMGARLVLTLRLAPVGDRRERVIAESAVPRSRLPQITRRPPDPTRTPTATADREAPRQTLLGNLLVIDDDPSTRRAVGRALRTNWNVTTAAGSADARAVLRERPVDVILCDLNLVQEDALDVINVVRNVRPELVERCVFMSGEPTSGRLVSLALANPERLIRKPFEREAALTLIDQARMNLLPSLETPDDDHTPDQMAVLEPAWALDAPTEEVVIRKHGPPGVKV